MDEAAFNALADRSAALRQAGHADEAAAAAKAAIRHMPLFIDHADEVGGAPGRPRLLQIVGVERAPVFFVGARQVAASGSLPTGQLIDRGRFRVVFAFLGHGGAELEAAMIPPCDAVVNAIADADLEARSLPWAERLIERLGWPVVNPPARVRQTTRDAVAGALEGIDGVRVARAARLRLDDRRQPGSLADELVERLGLPLIVRPTGTHTGLGMRRVEEIGALAQWLRDQPLGEIYASQFLDCRDGDGLHRKLRVFVVGGEVYPQHLLALPDWNVHNVAARRHMAGDARARGQERDLLAGWPATLAPAQLERFQEIARRLGLDVLGIDASPRPDGSLVVFEANACTRLASANTFALAPELEEPTRRIQGAFTRLLERTVAGGPVQARS